MLSNPDLLRKTVLMFRFVCIDRHARIVGADMNISLWKCDFDTGFPEFRVDCAIDLMPNRNPFIHPGDIQSQIEVQAVVTESSENNHGFWILHDHWIRCCHFIENFLGFGNIGAIGYTYGELLAQNVVR